MNARWQAWDDPAAWLSAATLYVRRAESEAVAARGVFHIVLAGGATPRGLYEALARERHDWDRWQVWFGDERCLAADDPARNSTMARRALLEHVPVPGANCHFIAAELGATKAAEVYAESVRRVGSFDLVLLGLGEDAHVASLFPGHAWGEADDAPDVLAVFEAPKPPSERVSLSARRLSRARHVLFLVRGAGKRGALKVWREGKNIPAAAIRPAAGVDVFMDRDAVPIGE